MTNRTPRARAQNRPITSRSPTNGKWYSTHRRSKCSGPSGDAALTRRVKAAGACWAVQEKKGRQVFSRGVWAPAATVERVRAELAAERATAAYARRREAGAARQAKAQADYVEEFYGAVV